MVKKQVARYCKLEWIPQCMCFSCVQLFVTTQTVAHHGILQARILETNAVPFSRGYSRPRDRTLVSCIAGRCFTNSFSLKKENIFRHHSVLDLDWKNEPRLWILLPPFWYRPPQSLPVKRLRGRTIVMIAKGSGPYWSFRSHIFKNYWCWGEETASSSGRAPRGCDPLAFLLLFCRKPPF